MPYFIRLIYKYDSVALIVKYSTRQKPLSPLPRNVQCPDLQVTSSSQVSYMFLVTENVLQICNFFQTVQKLF
jgi:hypothetical protein